MTTPDQYPADPNDYPPAHPLVGVLWFVMLCLMGFAFVDYALTDVDQFNARLQVLQP